MMRNTHAIMLAGLMVSALPVGATTLSGTIRDFCNPAIAGTCSVVYHKDSAADSTANTADFEGPITGLVTGMVSPTLNASGLPDYVAPTGTGAADADSFTNWYTDVAGVNMSKAFSLTLTETAPGSGIYSYSNGNFFPVDGELFGNQGNSHNYHFTMHLEGLLSFDGDTVGGNDTFAFTGDDDLWIYVDGKLLMDLGGVHGPTTDTFSESDLIAAGLLPNTFYDLDVFFAERHTTQSSFTITTSLTVLAPPAAVPEPGILSLLGLGLFGLGLMHRKRI